MSSGNDIQSGGNTTGESTTTLIADTTNDDPPVDFNGDTIFVVSPSVTAQKPFHQINGIVGFGWNGSEDFGGAGVVGAGGPNQGTGVAGFGGGADNGSGGIGVYGLGGFGTSFGFGPIDPGVGVYGQGGAVDPDNPPPTPGAPGVMGVASGTADGVVGTSNASNQSGVSGFNGQNFGAFGVFGRVDSPSGAGVGAFNKSGVGVFGQSGGEPGFGSYGVAGVVEDAAVPGASRAGVLGVTLNDFGVWGMIDSSNPSDGASAVFGSAGISINADGSISYIGLAGNFVGPVAMDNNLKVFGDLTVFGAKSAAVRHPDGSYRKLYCVESPQSWFEDFAEATLINGKAHVDLDPDFAALIDGDNYHVFLTPYGDCNGLYASGRSNRGFDVAEMRGGASNLGFSYRVVAGRKDIVSERLARTEAPVAARQRDALQPQRVSITAEQLAQLSSGATFPRPQVPKVPALK